MNKNVLTELAKRGYSSYRIAKEINKSQSVVYRALIRFDIPTKQISDCQKDRFCLTCKKKLTGKQSSFCSRKCNNNKSGGSQRRYNLSKKRGKERRIKLIELKGGKCENCGYNKNFAVLSFHHKNPKEKSFNLNRCFQHNWEALIEEAKKCSLLCANCHMELHHPNFLKD